MGTTQKKDCFTIPFINSTASPVEYVLFASNRKPATAVNWAELSSQFGVLAQKHSEIQNNFATAGTPFAPSDYYAVLANTTPPLTPFDASFLPTATPPDNNVLWYRVANWANVATLFQESAVAFTAITQALNAQALAETNGEVQNYEQIAREVALAPIVVNTITLTTNNFEQLSQIYTYNKNLVLRGGEEQNIDFYNKYNPKWVGNKVTLNKEDLQGGLRFDGMTAFRFTLLPGTSMSFQFCYALASDMPKKVEKPPRPVPTIKPKAPAIPLPTKPAPKRTFNWLYIILPILLLVIILIILWQRKKEIGKFKLNLR